MAPSGDWVTAETLRAGSFFFRGPHVVPTVRIALRYGQDKEGFLGLGRRLGGQAVEMGDACIQVPVVPRISVRLVLWQGDEEFIPQGSILFDSTVPDYLPTYDITVLCETISWKLVRYGSRCWSILY